MFLCIMCCHLQVADRRMATAVKLVLAQPLVAGVSSLMGQLMGNGMLNGCPFAQRRPATFSPELGTQFLLERLILTDRQGPTMPELSGRALRALGTCVTGTGRKRHRAAWGHRHRLAARPRHRPVGEVEGEVRLAEQRPSAWSRTGNKVPWLKGGCSAPRQSSTISACEGARGGWTSPVHSLY